MKNWIAGTIVALATCAAPMFADTFEGCSLGSWTAVGSVSLGGALDPDYSRPLQGPNEGSCQAILTGGGGVNAASLAATLGVTLPNSPLGQPLFGGSAIYKDFPTGGTLLQAWNYISTEGDFFEDPAYLTISGAGGGVFLLAYGGQAGVGFCCSAGISGYQNFPSTALAPGARVGFVVFNSADNGNDPFLLVDAQTVSTVPEPATGAFTIAGGALVVALRRRFRT